ncbi:alanine--tRNA ligase [Candidatus Parcubacteria bacterium 4484_255]|nr:MAG: alanine--tRNA ligase [Candidatus Parcubacteria bacterium 4484_255]
MKIKEIRQVFLDYFQEKGHKIVPSSSLIPADPSALFTSAGMQQFIPFLSGETDPVDNEICSVQKCFRTSDIEKVGDEFHHTFFQMLGNWSFNSYFKKEAIQMAIDLLTNHYHLDISRIWITIFKGTKGIKIDKSAEKIWIENGIPKERISYFGIKDNFWGPIGNSGPCGPCSEIYYDRGESFKKTKCSLKNCGPNCNCGRFVEIWNLVFMEYNKREDGSYEKLSVKNIDTGMGLARLACILQDKSSDYETDLFLPLMIKIKEIANVDKINQRYQRIIADHIRAACFLISAGILPTKEDRGYVLRRIIRRAMRYGKLINNKEIFLIPLAKIVIALYSDFYPELQQNQTNILTVIEREEEKFGRTLKKGLERINKLFENYSGKEKNFALSAKDFFDLHQTFGYPFELSIEEINRRRRENGGDDIPKDVENHFSKLFYQEFKKHQEISRAGVQKKFGGLGINKIKNQKSKIKIIRLHTATHLLHQALREVLGDSVHQAGSDINPERLRFDFTYSQKLTEEEKSKIEKIVNKKIQEALPVTMEEMPYKQAIKKGALAFFREKYPEIVKVYSIGDFSREICAGPHVKNTKELGQFKIIKEKSSSAGIRRIKAILY